MIKLLAMSLFIVVGAIVGLLFHRMIGNRNLPAPLCMGLGVIGSFAGIWVADIADLHLVSTTIDGIIFATAGSTLVLALNLLIRGRRRN